MSYGKQPPRQVGGALCLDFVNTVTWRGDPAARAERLVSYEELLHWARRVGNLSPGEARRLLAEARRRPGVARSILVRALVLREALAQLLLRAGDPGSRTKLGILNHMLAAAPRRSTLQVKRGRYGWVDGRRAERLERPLYPVLWNAAELLTSGEARRVRRCADSRCAWLFLDTSRTHRRRWCSMDDCGNRAKVRRHYQRSHPSPRRSKAARPQSASSSSL
jgi:predicted RNA-binding Zn ribbon-like protein